MITLIFGAGASVPFFNPQLSTKYLTKKICDAQQWKKVLKRYKEVKNYQLDCTMILYIINIINIIKEIHKDANFEQIAEVIDKISSYGFDKIADHNMFNLIVFMMLKVFGHCEEVPLSPEWKDVPFLLREIIAEAILDLQKKHKTGRYNILINDQHNFIKNICECDDFVNIVSLNYDDCIFDSLVGLEFETGFHNSTGHYLTQLNIKQFMEAKKVLYFPHGNLKFQYVDNNNVTFWLDSNVANDKRWESIDALVTGSTLTVLPGLFSYNFNTFISTGQTKDEGMNNIPYAVYYQRLAIDLFRSDSVFIIGYSFGDNHINRLLMSFMQLSKYNHIYIVDYYPDELTMAEEYKDSKNLINKIYGVFKPIWEFYGLNEGLTFAHPNEIGKINRMGYGEIFSQITFYKKGYEEFLSEYHNVIRSNQP